MLEADLIHGDETELQVLKEPGRAAQRKSYLWAQMSGAGPPIRLFTYCASRSGQTALTLYEGARGALVTDGYEVYGSVAHANGLVHLGCWAHARRRFVEAEAERLVLAHRHAVLPQSLLARALRYLAGEWPKLVRFVDDGRYPIDNNTCENAIRPFVIGRRNWLFADTVAGATASANLYSLIETAKANRIEPYRYLCALFAALPNAATLQAYEALLPWRIKLAATE